jgi:putative heme-binding domain-containing protein
MHMSITIARTLRSFLGRNIFLLFALAFASVANAEAAQPWLVLQGQQGPGAGKHVVFVSGDEEYRSEESLPMLARILAARHGFKCTVLFAINKQTGEIDPNTLDNIPGLETLATADVMVICTRFRELPDEQMKYVDAYLKSGKPVIGIRPAVVAFRNRKESAFFKYSSNYKGAEYADGFGQEVLGSTWISHHGAHGIESSRGIPVEAMRAHPILRGVESMWGPSDVYTIRTPIPHNGQVLVMGQVLQGMNPDTAPSTKPQMPLAWTKDYPTVKGNARIFMTTMGTSEDFLSEGFRRMMVNACFWTLGLEDKIPAQSNVEFVGVYAPTPFGFNQFRKGVTPAMLAVAAAPPVMFELRLHDRVAFVGNSLAERMNLHGHFESLLHARFPNLELAVRNFGWPGDEAGLQQRPDNYTAIDDPFSVFGANVFFCFFGYNESFAGRDGLVKFKENLAGYISKTRAKLTNDAARFVFVSPTAFENASDPFRPDGVTHNASLRLYAGAMQEVAEQLGLPFVELFTPALREFAAQPKLQFTSDGVHLNERGDRLVAELIDRALFTTPNPARIGLPDFERLRAAVNDKSFVHWNDYRMVNGWYVYGGRRAPYDTETFPAEYKKLRRMAAVRDRYVWDIAQGKLVSAAPDDSATGDLALPKTSFGTKLYSEPKDLRYLTPDEAMQAFTLAPGYAINCFASEAQFPELANPVQINFDNRGRLWALVMPTYPQWKPGNPKPDDKLLIFEDTNGDGVADRVKTFAGGLHVPIGFEFGQDGVFVAQPPHLLFLKDTDGDDRADTREVVLDGFGSEDTHVGICALEWSHGGELILLEGVAKSTTVETLYGPWRNHTPTVYGFDPRTQRLRVHIKPAVVNPWACVFDGWGQGFYGDGTTAAQHWMTPLSGAPFAGRKGMDEFTKYPGTRLRPIAGCEFVSSRQFPDRAQGNYLFACVINMNGIPQFRVRDDDSGFVGERVEDLVVSSDRNFRPVDPQFGPDGAIYFADWHTPLIGHMQYSQRDPNRDHTHGRLYRIVAKDRPLLTPIIAAGVPLPALLDQLKSPEDRTRYRARRELRDRDQQEVLDALRVWIASLDRHDSHYEHHLCEALWVQQGFHAVDMGLLKTVLAAKDFHARAAAVHLLAEEREFLFNTNAAVALALCRPLVTDSHPRVRLEAVRALSFFPSIAAVELALEAVALPLDYSLRYTLESTLGALEPVWKPALARNEIARGNPAGLEFLRDRELSRQPGALAQKYFATLLHGDVNAETKARAIATLAATRGKPDAGKAVFSRLCVACHKVGNLGTELGPTLSDVGKRLPRAEIVESVMDTNAKVDAKYYGVNITTRDGDEFSGLIVSEDAQVISLRMGAEITKQINKGNITARETLKTSGMPDGLAAALSAQEFVDLIEFLAAQR